MDKNNNQDKFGFMLINKPIGPTSHDMVYKLRKITNIKKIGHAGTLDPFADGLLVMAINRKATREIDNFVKLDKEYIAVLNLGKETDSYDNEGKVTKEHEIKEIINIKDVKEVVESFKGKQKQIPPMFSAKKVNGKKLYELARKGEVIEREPCDIEIFEIELLSYKWPEIKIRVQCSTGTYIRTLGYDIGRKLGCGAYLNALTRTKIGEHDLKNAVDIEKVYAENWEEKLFQL